MTQQDTGLLGRIASLFERDLPPRCRVRGVGGVWWLEFYPMCLPHPVWYDDLKQAQRKAEFFNNREDLKAFL